MLTESGKVIIDRKLADAIEYLRNSEGWTGLELARVAAVADQRPKRPMRRESIPYVLEVEHANPEAVLRALYAGYEVQKTLAEELEQLVNRSKEADDHENDMILYGISQALLIFGAH